MVDMENRKSGLGQVLRVIAAGLASLFLVLVNSGCLTQGSGTPTSQAEPSETPPLGEQIAPTALAAAFPSPSPTAAPPTPTSVVVLPSEPIAVDFQAADGQALSGLYYPGSVNPAPVIVLMHWARGDQTEWDPIARWLQGRGGLAIAPDYNKSWKSSDWYPERDPNLPLGVFTFDFRECRGSCQAYLPAEWLLDARAAVLTAAGLEGADPDRIITAGASIGADGAVDACAWLDQTGQGNCRGSFAISPASLLTVAFNESAAQILDADPAYPVYCLYGLRDDASVETCQGTPGVEAVDYGYVEDHGFELLRAGRSPDPLQLLQEFILDAVGEE